MTDNSEKDWTIDAADGERLAKFYVRSMRDSSDVSLLIGRVRQWFGDIDATQIGFFTELATQLVFEKEAGSTATEPPSTSKVALHIVK